MADYMIHGRDGWSAKRNRMIGSRFMRSGGEKTPRRTDARFRRSLLLVLGPKDMGIAAAA